MDTKEHGPSLAEDTEDGARNVSGLGALLKREREGKRLSRQQVAEMTRLRVHMIEGLENEDWGSLPAPAFVRGFIRSYAKAIHLDERSILELYNKIAPAGGESLNPLVEKPGRAKKGVLLLILMLGAMAAMIYLWRGYGPSDKAHLPEEGERQVSLTRSSAGPGMKTEAPKEDREERQPAKATVSDSAQLEPGAPSGERPGPGESSLPSEARMGYSEASVPEAASTASEYELAATVGAKTWVRIRIDDQEPKEYMFQPGHRHQWGAKKGFLIVIGNAGGIDFALNGKKMASLGRSGQVVRLRLPEDFRETRGED